MNTQTKTISKACRDELEENIPNAPIIHYLVANGILNVKQKQKLLQCKSDFEANKLLLDELSVCDPYPFPELCSALRDVGQYRLLNILDSDLHADPNESDAPLELENTEDVNICEEKELCEIIEEILQCTIRPDALFNETCTKAYKAVKSSFQQYCSDNEIRCKVSKGGSFGKDTHVRCQSDVDVLVELTDYTVLDLYERLNGRNGLMQSIADYLTNKSGQDINIALNTKRVLKFEIKIRDRKTIVPIDLVLVANILEQCKSDDKEVETRRISEIYENMEKEDNEDLLRLYSKCLSKLQIDFVKSKPKEVKDVIRLLKYWNTQERVGTRSICIEFVVINEWQDDTTASIQCLLVKSIEALSCYRQLKVACNEYYASQRYTTNLSAPYILDPTNPFNNVHPDECDARRSNAKRIERKAYTLYEHIAHHFCQIENYHCFEEHLTCSLF